VDVELVEATTSNGADGSTPVNWAAIMTRPEMDVVPVTVIVSPAARAFVTIVDMTCPPVVAVEGLSIVYVFPAVSATDDTVPTPLPFNPMTIRSPTGTPPAATVPAMVADDEEFATWHTVLTYVGVW
jgi:hypothetical protein